MKTKKMAIEWAYFWGTFAGASFLVLMSVLMAGEDVASFLLLSLITALLSLFLVALPIGIARRHIKKGGNDPVKLAIFTLSIEALFPIIGAVWLESKNLGNGDHWPAILAYCVLGAISLVGATQAKKEAEKERAEQNAVPFEAPSIEPHAAPVVVHELPEAAPIIVTDEEPLPTAEPIDTPVVLPVIEQPVTQPAAKPNRKAIYALSAACCILLSVVVAYEIDDKRLHDEVVSLTAQSEDMREEIALLTAEIDEREKEVASVRGLLDQTRTGYNSALGKVNRIEAVLRFYYDSTGVMDSDNKQYYHRMGVGCPLLDQAEYIYIHNTEYFSSRTKPCPYCYSRKADFPIDDVTLKY